MPRRRTRRGDRILIAAMSQIAKYVTIADYPYPLRSEHVNIGIAVFLPNGNNRIHLGTDLRKVRALYPRARLDVVRQWESELPAMISGLSLEEARQRFVVLGNDWRLGDQVGRFSFESDDDYLHRVRMALANLVDPVAPRRELRDPTSRLFFDLKRTFEIKGWLGKDIEAHQIVPRFPVGPEVTAEFALKNGRLHVIESLDLRVSNTSAKRQEAQAKALAFDMARRLDKNAASYAVMAGLSSPIANGTRELLSAYADRVYAWESPADMKDLLTTIGQATGKPEMPLPMPN